MAEFLSGEYQDAEGFSYDTILESIASSEVSAQARAFADERFANDEVGALHFFTLLDHACSDAHCCAEYGVAQAGKDAMAAARTLVEEMAAEIDEKRYG